MTIVILIRLRIDLGEHVPRVVTLPMRFLSRFGCERNRPPICNTIFGTASRNRPMN